MRPSRRRHRCPGASVLLGLSIFQFPLSQQLRYDFGACLSGDNLLQIKLSFLIISMRVSIVLAMHHEVQVGGAPRSFVLRKDFELIRSLAVRRFLEL